MKRYLFLMTGCVSLILGSVGTVVPVLPTTPFLLLTAVCFAKGSERCNTWFMKTKLYEKYLERYLAERSMTLKSKLLILFTASAMMAVSGYLVELMAVRILLFVLALIQWWYFFFRIKTRKM